MFFMLAILNSGLEVEVTKNFATSSIDTRMKRSCAAINCWFFSVVSNKNTEVWVERRGVVLTVWEHRTEKKGEITFMCQFSS